MISKTRIASIKILMNLLKLKYTSQEDLVLSFTNARTTHVSQMEENEGQELYQHLCQLNRASRPNNYAADPRDKQRKAIIAIFKRKGKTVSDAIEWAEKTGVSGIKKKFNDYNGQELYHLTTKAELLK